VIGINLADDRDDAIVEGQKPGPLRVGRLVHGIVACNPWVSFVAFGDVPPQIDSPILKVDVIPKGGVTGGIVRVPVLILTSREGMQVEDSVNVVLGTLQRVNKRRAAQNGVILQCR
jgi:hypothetical protein